MNFLTQFLKNLLTPRDLPDPKDRIKTSQIKVSKSKLTIEQKDITWAPIANSESMNPVIDQGHHAFFLPAKKSDLQVGDIISFHRKLDNKDNVMHRIIQIGTDQDGWYAITKGDNTYTNDGKTRFKDIKKVLIGIIY
jgi:signal peptidase I